mgnify:CR=1 FL=1
MDARVDKTETGISGLPDKGDAVRLDGVQVTLSSRAGPVEILKGIDVASQTLNGLSEDQLAVFRRDNIGIVFQSFHLIPAMTALENVAVPLELRGTGDAFDVAREQLKRVGLEHRLDHYPGQLSGGEQQRVAIARALAAGANIILADEPTGNLDQETGHTIMDLLFDLQSRGETTLVLLTHDPDLAARCSRTIEIRDGLIHTDSVTRS